MPRHSMLIELGGGGLPPKCWTRLGSSFELDPTIILEPAGTFLLGYWTLSSFFSYFWTLDHSFLLRSQNMDCFSFFYFASAFGLCIIFVVFPDF